MAVNRLLCPQHKRAIQRGVLLTQSLGQSAEDAAGQIGRGMPPSFLKKPNMHLFDRGSVRENVSSHL